MAGHCSKTSGWSDWTYQVYLYFSKVLGSPNPRTEVPSAVPEERTCRENGHLLLGLTELLSRIISSCYETALLSTCQLHQSPHVTRSDSKCIKKPWLVVNHDLASLCQSILAPEVEVETQNDDDNEHIRTVSGHSGQLVNLHTASTIQTYTRQP